MPEPLNVKGKRILVVGLGRSGVAAALFLQERGAVVTVSDARAEDLLHEHIPALLDRGITVETGGHGDRTFRHQDLIVLSPGVPTDVEPVVHARHQGTPIIGEIELAFRFLKGHLVGITGSNGKTTTTALTADVIAAGGFKVLVGGNIGIPAVSLAEQSSDAGYTVLEVSSFQLETIQTFHPQIAIVLNVTPDHLDRHRTMEAYIAAKQRIFENQTAADWAVLNADDPICVRMEEGVRAGVRWFSRKGEVERGAFVREGRVRYRDENGEREIMRVDEIPLKGLHNLENVLAAVCVGILAGCEPRQIRFAVTCFKAVEHRLEYVATVKGVEYYNDSKATNVDATLKALEAFSGRLHVILGGRDKGSDYSALIPLLGERAKRVYTIGAAADKIEGQIVGATEITRAGTLEIAVKKAAAAATPGDIVLLAPACASFDQFENFEHRGRIFKELVRALAGRTGTAA